MALRIGWSIKRGAAEAGEAQNVARALARGAGFADPYFPGSGPTAHLMPTTPLIAGGVYSVFGVGSPLSEIILQLLAFVEIFGGYLLMRDVFLRLGASGAACTAATAALALLPVFMGQESLDFRYWEGALALLLALACLRQLIILESRTTPPHFADEFGMALLFVMTSFVSPALGLGVGIGAISLLVRRTEWPQRWRAPAIAIVLLAAVFAPWATRNAIVLGRPIVLRSNAPLELSLANNPLTQRLPAADAFWAEMKEIHPSAGGPGSDRLREVGELRYFDELGMDVRRWIGAHRMAFARLCFQHLRQFFLPDPWQFEIGSGRFSTLRARMFAITSILGIMGIAIGLRRSPGLWQYPAIIIAVTAASYMPFQPMARYLYLIYGLMLFSAAYGLDYWRRRCWPAFR